MSVSGEAVHCPSCQENVKPRHEIKYHGEIIECEACSAELEVVSVQPLALQVAPEPEEDWGE